MKWPPDSASIDRLSIPDLIADPPVNASGRGPLGLALAILIDITLVRALLLPATMAIAGRWNWYLPRWATRALMLRP